MSLRAVASYGGRQRPAGLTRVSALARLAAGDAHLAALAFVVLASFLSPPPVQASCPRRHVDPQGLSITSAALPPVAFTSGRPPRSIDLRDLGAAGPYVLTITADDGETPVARDSMSFDWSGERTLYFNHRKAADKPADGRQE